MSNEMNQEGVTKARPKQWKVWNPPGKRSVAISILFQVEAMYDVEAGEWTDDTAQSLIIAESYIENNGCDFQDIADEVARRAALIQEKDKPGRKKGYDALGMPLDDTVK